MRLSRCGFALGFGLALQCVTGAAHAESIYRYVFGQQAYTVAPGGTVLVDVFLQETVPGGDMARLAVEGLIGAGVRVRFDVPPLPTDPAEVLGLADILPNSAAFDDTLFLATNLVSGAHAELTEIVDVASPPVLGTEVAPGVFQVLLGSFRFTAGTLPGETTMIQAGDVPGTDDTITATGLSLDSLIGSAEARISVIPEPASLMLLGAGTLVLFGYTRRRRRTTTERLSHKANNWGSSDVELV